MDLFRMAEPQRTIVKTYGRGSFLGLLSPLLAMFMAGRGMHGWRDSTVRAMEADASEMLRRGYRISSTEEATLPAFGASSFKVTYERIDPPSDPSS
jgi:hypothetical protein